MQKKCDYCENFFDDTLEKCPFCGAPNEHVARSSDEAPRTIEELKQWYVSHNLPPEEVTRYFIGKNLKDKRVIGIYKDEDTGNFVVYKNKDNGQRAVRYEGKDEKYAVNEIYQRLRSEIANQKTASKSRPMPKHKSKGILDFILWHPFLFFFIIILLMGIVSAMIPSDAGYYNYNGQQYYYNDSTWYYYDDILDDWTYAYDLDSDFLDNYSDYYQSGSYDSSYGGYDFSDSDYGYSSNSSDWGSDWDNDSSWDSGWDSWDSGGSDWDSDW